MLRKIRITLALLFFTAVTLLFLDFTGTVHAWLGWTAKVQFLPAVLALNVGVVALLVVMTLLLGRVYCSVICPSEAILMVLSDEQDERSVKIPVVNAERCIGCGACENLCPARPFSAIYVEGHTMHSEM